MWADAPPGLFPLPLELCSLTEAPLLLPANVFQILPPVQRELTYSVNGGTNISCHTHTLLWRWHYYRAFLRAREEPPGSRRDFCCQLPPGCPISPGVSLKCCRAHKDPNASLPVPPLRCPCQSQDARQIREAVDRPGGWRELQGPLLECAVWVNLACLAVAGTECHLLRQ